MSANGAYNKQRALNAGYARLSKSGKVIVLYLTGDDDVRRLTLDIATMFELTSKKLLEMDVIEYVD
jgi:hypothetical protein